jgi:hypothetical protein
MRSFVKLICVVLLVTGSGGCRPAKAPSQGRGLKQAGENPDDPSLSVNLLKDKLQFTHAGPQGTDVVDVDLGFAGHATSVKGPNYDVVVMLAWPSPTAGGRDRSQLIGSPGAE